MCGSGDIGRRKIPVRMGEVHLFKIYMAKKLQLSVSMVKFTSVVIRVGKLECMLKFGSALLV